MSDQNSATNKGLGFIGEDLFIEGTVHAQKKMVVSGTVNGSVSGDQEIVVTESGNVIGRIDANIILVAGKVPSGQLLIKEGAQLEARCTTLNEKPQGVISSS